MAFGIKWLEGDSVGTSDIFEATDLKQTGDSPRIIEHAVLSDKGALYKEPAICIVASTGKVATLDYGCFASDNEKRGFIAGQMQLDINLDDSPHITAVRWRNCDTEKFEGYKFEYVRRKSSRDLKQINEQQQRISAVLAQLDDEDLEKILPPCGNMPERINVMTTAFIRNPAVVVAARRRAGGRCENCQEEAPFINATTGEPYLEVHHKVQLANNGSDDLKNTISVCPNCHRKFHYG